MVEIVDVALTAASLLVLHVPCAELFTSGGTPPPKAIPEVAVQLPDGRHTQGHRSPTPSKKRCRAEEPDLMAAIHQLEPCNSFTLDWASDSN